MANLYERGVSFERELVNKFWSRGWASFRCAGSGSIPETVPDVIAIKSNDVVALECKKTKSEKISLKKDVTNLSNFSEISGARCYIAVKFTRELPRFFRIDDIIARGNYTISLKTPHLNFDALIREQTLL